jgi:mannose/cellobiose epimerase-like protein (N-acyl-D-glucosamine 2-epimerase family)
MPTHRRETPPPPPDFHASDFLARHVGWLMEFYHPRAVDPRGGYFHFYGLDGSIIRPNTRTLVSSARMVVSFCMAARVLRRPDLAEAARHGIAFLQRVHRNTSTGGYAWEVAWNGERFVTSDDSNQAYGLAHVGLAYAHAAATGIPPAKAGLDGVFGVMERYMKDAAQPLYREEFTADWQPLSPYRGQNSNMHAAEAWLAAFAATADRRYLDRAVDIGKTLCVVLAQASHGLVYEHFDAAWRPDWRYNEGDFSNIYRPWGFQPGHQTEWAKLLLTMSRLTGDPSLAERARELFDATVERAWDREHGGLVYGLAPDLSVCNWDKYFWVQIESAVAAAYLADRFPDGDYGAWYRRFWTIAWDHFVDHQHGSWFPTLGRDFALKSPDKAQGGKDYHVVGACFDLIEAGVDGRRSHR